MQHCGCLLLPTPSFAAVRTRDLRSSTGIHHGTGLFVLTLTGDRIGAMTRFENSVLPWFGLLRSLPANRPVEAGASASDYP
jgi:hypothetical protein